MIYHNRSVWPEPDARHRRIREEIHAGTASSVTVTGYLEYAKRHLLVIAHVFQTQFSDSYRRRSINSRIEVSDDLSIGAHASARVGAAPTITVNLGLLLALEDMWQSVISDNHTDLAFWLGSQPGPFGMSPDVARSVEFFHTFDAIRYVDYTKIVAVLEAVQKNNGDLGNGDALCALMFKLLSDEPIRRRNASILSDLSMQWILAHEDAHIYLGHASGLRETLGVSAGELSNSDMSARIQEIMRIRGYAKQKQIRFHAEIQADRMACFRLIDYILDEDIFAMFQMLHKGREFVQQDLSEEVELDDEEANLLLVFRIAVTVGISSIMLFQRNIEKHDLDSELYPDVDTRIANIVFSCFLRMWQRLKLSKSGEIDPQPFLYHERLFHVVFRLINDYNVMHSYLLEHPALLVDRDLVGRRFQAARIDPTEDNPLFVSFYFARACVSETNFPMAAGIARQWPHLQRLLKAYADVEQFIADNFFVHQKSIQPHIPTKVEEMLASAKHEAKSAQIVLDFINVTSEDTEIQSAAVMRLAKLLNLIPGDK